MQNILAIFEAEEERVEGLALAFGLGAVQKKASIRLRHLNPAPDAAAIENESSLVILAF